VRRPLLAAAAGLLCAAPAAAAATPQIQAHRGGSFVAGKATYAENTLPAFRAAARRGFVLEMDTRVAQDGVVVLHDAAVDRTTACEGDVADMTLAALAGCPSDVAGSPGSLLGWRRTTKTTPVPLLAAVLAAAKSAKATVSIELNDFDPEGTAAGRVLDVIAAAGLPPRRVIVQSFFPPNLARARQRLPGVALAVLTLKVGNPNAIEAAKNAGAKWVSPEWPVDRAFVRRAHGEGLKVVPYTLNRRSAVRAAGRAGVDALITDDPTMARRALRRR
jgi:glycerophosphoryl diester phosphodiesterase